MRKKIIVELETDDNMVYAANGEYLGITSNPDAQELAGEVAEVSAPAREDISKLVALGVTVDDLLKLRATGLL